VCGWKEQGDGIDGGGRRRDEEGGKWGQEGDGGNGYEECLGLSAHEKQRGRAREGGVR